MNTKNITLVFTIIVFLFTGFNLTLAQTKVKKEKVTIKKHKMMKDSTAMHNTKMKKMMDKKDGKMMKDCCKAMMDNPEMQKMMKKMMKKMKGKMDGKMMGKKDGKMMPDSSKKMDDAIHKSHHPDKKNKDK